MSAMLAMCCSQRRANYSWLDWGERKKRKIRLGCRKGARSTL